jgi:hypothetical protein
MRDEPHAHFDDTWIDEQRDRIIWCSSKRLCCRLAGFVLRHVLPDVYNFDIQ